MLIFLLLVAAVGATSPRHPTESHRCPPKEKLFKPLPCPPRNCNIQYNATYSCKEQPRVPGCDCIENYSRLPNGTCIQNEYCPPPDRVCGPNETYYFEIACPPNACDRDYTSYNCDVIPRKRGCDCKRNYLRHPHGSCVLKEECPPKPICGPNERHYHLRPCPIRDCETRFNNATCSGPQTYGCDCKENYFRNSHGLCVPEKDCPVQGGVCGVNEKFYNVAPCPPLKCKNSAKTTKVTCDGVQGRPGCDCKENYMRHPNGTCIFYKYCPRQCAVNETEVPCNRKCPDQYCPQDDSGNFTCVTPRTCVAQCACKPNYLWQAYEYERCILATECPKINCTKANEEWNSCASPCRKESCDSVCDESGTQTNETCKAVCEPRCVCKQGYWKNSNNTCVPANQCPLKKKGCPKVKRVQLSDDNNSDDDENNAKDNNNADDKNNVRDNNYANVTDEHHCRDCDSDSSDQSNSDDDQNDAKDNNNADGKNNPRYNNNADDTDEDHSRDYDTNSSDQRNYHDDKNNAKHNNNANGKNNARDNKNAEDTDEDHSHDCDSNSSDQRNSDDDKNYAKDSNNANGKNNARDNNNADDTDKDHSRDCDTNSSDQRNYHDDKNNAKYNNNADGKNNARDNNNADDTEEDNTRDCDSDSSDQKNYHDDKNNAKDNNNADNTDKDDIHDCDNNSSNQKKLKRGHKM